MLKHYVHVHSFNDVALTKHRGHRYSFLMVGYGDGIFMVCLTVSAKGMKHSASDKEGILCAIYH